MESEHFLVQPGRPKQPTPSRAKPPKPLPKKRKEPRLTTAGKVQAGQKLVPIVQDRKYLDDMRDDACTFTGLHALPHDPVEAMHVGNPGKGLKNDAESFPALHSIHDLTHRNGITAIIPYLEANPPLLLAVLRAYARERRRNYELEKKP